MRLLILLALWPAFARAQTIDEAFPPTIRFEQRMMWGCRVKIDRAKLDTAAAPLSWLTVELSSDRPCHWAELTVDLPAGTRVVGMEVASDGVRSWSAARPVREARAAAGRARRALLEWESTSADQDHLRLVIPMPARLDLALELPPLDHVVIDAGKRSDVDLRGVSTRTTPAPYDYADARTALVTNAPNRDEPEPIARRWSSVPSGRSNKAGIRRVIKQNLARITYCYERIAQWRGEIEGNATLQFFIDKDGAVERVATAATDLPPSITSCLEAVIRELRFADVDGPMLVNYPLAFSTADY